MFFDLYLNSEHIVGQLKRVCGHTSIATSIFISNKLSLVLWSVLSFTQLHIKSCKHQLEYDS
jgi:hypothetical protein